MLAEALGLWKRSVGQTGTWTVLVWMVASGVVVAVIFGLVAASAFQSYRFAHPGSYPFASPYMPMSPLFGGTSPFNTTLPRPFFFAPGVVRALIAPMALMFLVYLALVPFLAAGIYGTISRAVMGEQVSWGTFWTMARRLYTRAWGLLLYTFLYAIAFGIVAGVLFAVLRAFAIVVIVLVPIFSIPLWVRLAGALFMDERDFGASVGHSFTGGNYWVILGGALLGVVVTGVGMMVLLVLSHLTAIFAIVYFLAAIALTVAAPSWFLALYRAATPVS